MRSQFRAFIIQPPCLGTSLCVAMCATVCLTLPNALAQCAPFEQPYTNLSSAVGRFAVDAHTVIGPNGDAHVVYQNFLDSSGRNYYTHNMSGSFSSPQLLANMGGKGSIPRIVLTPDDQLHAFFGKNTLFWSTKPRVGGSWTSPIQLSSSGGFIWNVVVDASGGIYFMYGSLFQDNRTPRNSIWGRYKPFQQSWGGDELIYGNSDDGNWPRGEHLAVDGNTLWVAIGADGNMHFKKKQAGAAWPAGKGTLFNEDGGGLHFAFDPTSNEMAALWAVSLPCDDPCEDDPWFEVYAKYSYDGGTTWINKTNISLMVDDIDRSPYGTYDANGNLHVVWEGFCCDHKSRLRYRGRIGSIWGDIIPLTLGNTSGLAADPIMSAGNNLYLTLNMTGAGVPGMWDAFFTQAIVTEPRINLSPESIEHTINIGNNINSETFVISNGCVSTLNYTLTPNVGWLSPTPSSGTSQTDVDTITINYNTTGLHAGSHIGVIAAAGNAFNSPQQVVVEVEVLTVGPDFDGDGDVDQTDYGHFQACLTGSSVHQNDPACQDARLDGDEDVDQNDFGILQGCFTGANIIASPICDD